MKKKKTIIICVFVTLIMITAICAVLSAVAAHRYDPGSGPGVSGVDFLPRTLGVFIILIYGTVAILYELDLFYTVYYFLVKPKTKAKSILNILSNLSLLLLFLNILMLLLYVELRFAYFLVSVFTRALNQNSSNAPPVIDTVTKP
ncbi:MAG: hypothetical protein IKA06_06725 [Clostridia bacterium]|nr:hypothetical protein [Clostridia bacterium]